MKPMTIASRFGLLLIFIGSIFSLYLVYLKVFQGAVTAGMTSIISVIIIIGGFQIYFIGIVGEYVGRIFEESKRRPLYIVNEEINF